MPVAGSTRVKPTLYLNGSSFLPSRPIGHSATGMLSLSVSKSGNGRSSLVVETFRSPSLLHSHTPTSTSTSEGRTSSRSRQPLASSHFRYWRGRLARRAPPNPSPFPPPLV